MHEEMCKDDENVLSTTISVQVDNKKFTLSFPKDKELQ